MWRHLPATAALALAAVAAGAQSTGGDDLDEDFARGAIIIEAGENACYRFDVYLAETNAQHRRGLMFVRELPRLTGMLFVYPDSAMRSMWMKNTFIPLDILFIRADGTVSSIAQDTEPRSLASIASTEPIQYVLELNAGVTEELGIGPGSVIYFPPEL
ncbi:MAG TPA: DUF192 domain-containing protein [Woeseiaceae bacterium]|nr:DUF192 domain-containing protein [Woeseiaceae bacterium]